MQVVEYLDRPLCSQWRISMNKKRKRISSILAGILLSFILVVPAHAAQPEINASYDPASGTVSVSSIGLDPNKIYHLISIQKEDSVIALKSGDSNTEGKIKEKIPTGKLEKGSYHIYIYSNEDGSVVVSNTFAVGGGSDNPGGTVKPEDPDNPSGTVKPGGHNNPVGPGSPIKPEKGTNAGSGSSLGSTPDAISGMVNHFTDVPSGSYYENAVTWAVNKGVTKGTSTNTFSPNKVCTRAEAITFLWRASGSPTSNTSIKKFKDVTKDSYYYDAVAWAVEKGICFGTGKDTFSPNKNCNRAEIVTFIWRGQKSPVVNGSNPFNDVTTNAYYSKAVMWAVKENVTKGITESSFGPSNDCTRAQIVTLIWRTMGKR